MSITNPSSETPATGSVWETPASRARWLALARKRTARLQRQVAAQIALGVALAALGRLGPRMLGSLGPPMLLLCVAQIASLPGAILVLFGATGWLRIWRVRRRIVPLVMAHDACVCPGCGRVLEPDADGVFWCGDCLRTFDRCTLRRWWQYWAERRDEEADRLWPPSDPYRNGIQAIFGPPGRPSTGSVIALAGLMMVLWLLFAVPGGGLVALIDDGWLLMMGIPGVALLSHVWNLARRRVGNEWRCVRCGYARSPQGPHPLRCPECGLVWGPKGTLVRGRPRLRKRAAVIVTVGVVGLWLILVLQQRPFQGLTWRMVPTSSLMAQLADPAGLFARSALDELRRRQLTPGQRRELARRLIARVPKAPGHTYGEMWILRQIAAGSLDRDLTERYFRSRLRAELDTAGPLRVGRRARCRLELVSDTPSFAFANAQTTTYAVLASFTIDGVGRAQRLRGLVQPTRSTWWYKGPASIPWQPERPGRHRIEVTLWLAAGPMPPWPPGGSDRVPRFVQWNSDGTPVLPVGTLWSERIVLTREVEVLP